MFVHRQCIGNTVGKGGPNRPAKAREIFSWVRQKRCWNPPASGFGQRQSEHFDFLPTLKKKSDSGSLIGCLPPLTHCLSSTATLFPLKTFSHGIDSRLSYLSPPVGIREIRRGDGHLRGLPGLLGGHPDPPSHRSVFVPPLLLGGEGPFRELLPHAAAVLRQAHNRCRQVRLGESRARSLQKDEISFSGMPLSDSNEMENYRGVAT